jgi:hypothetical protein
VAAVAAGVRAVAAAVVVAGASPAGSR